MAWEHLARQADANLHISHREGGHEVWARVHTAIRLRNYSSALRALRVHILTHPNDYIAYDLRCLCALHCSDYELALNDALQCTSVNPEWARGWARLGAAQLCCGHPTAGISAYTQGLKLEPNNQELLSGLEVARRAVEKQGGKKRRAAIHDEN